MGARMQTIPCRFETDQEGVAPYNLQRALGRIYPSFSMLQAVTLRCLVCRGYLQLVVFDL